MRHGVKSVIAFGEPRLDADLASILAVPGPTDTGEAERLSPWRFAVDAVLVIAATLLLVQLLPRDASEPPLPPTRPIASGPISTPPGGVLPAIRDTNGKGVPADAAGPSPARSSPVKEAKQPAPRQVRDPAARAAPKREAAQPVRRAGPRRSVGFPAATSRDRPKPLIGGGQPAKPIKRHGPRHHRKH